MRYLRCTICSGRRGYARMVSDMGTEIYCTLGTTTDDRAVLEGMVEAGMKGARMNTAYATLDEYQRRLDMVRQVSDARIMMDLKGPQLRLYADEAVRFSAGDRVRIGYLSGNIRLSGDCLGDLLPDDQILFENGKMEGKVSRKGEEDVEVEMLCPDEGVLGSSMGVNIPGRYLSVNRLTEKDTEVLGFCVENRVEDVALSFVRDYEDVRNLYEVLKGTAEEKGSDYMPRIVAKIEDGFGVRNLYDIIRWSGDAGIDLGVMVARGDLAVEHPMEMLAFLQESIIGACRKEGVYCMTATGLLESMQYGMTPTRSEVCDVYNALRAGSDALLLSGETSNGVDPVNATQSLSYIINTYESRYQSL